MLNETNFVTYHEVREEIDANEVSGTALAGKGEVAVRRALKRRAR